MILSKDFEKILNLILEMSKEENYYKLLEDILEVGMNISNADGGTLYLLKEDKLEFFFMITKSLNIKEGGINKKINLPPVNINSESVAALCAKSKRVINVRDVYSDKQFNWTKPKEYDKLTGYHTESVLVLPLFDKKKNILGVMQLINATLFKNVVPFSYDVETILTTLSTLSGILLDNMYLYNSDRQLLNSFINIFIKAIDNKSKQNINKTIKEFINYLDVEDYKNKENDIIFASNLFDIGSLYLSNSNKLDIDLILTRYELISYYIEINYKNNLDKYNKEIELINNSKKFIVNINNKNKLDNNDISFAKEINKIKYVINNKDYYLLNNNEYDILINNNSISDKTSEILNDLSLDDRYIDIKNIIINFSKFINKEEVDNNLYKYVNILALAYLYEQNDINILNEYDFDLELKNKFIKFIG